jgi:SAM-dependent methyltransferase
MDRMWSEAESAYRRDILATLRPDPSARLLDVGCQDGEWTDAVRVKLAIPPRQVCALELDPTLAARARERGFDVRTADIDKSWPFEDASFDLVHANQVIEHIRRLDHFLRELRRVLTPDGSVVVCTENLASWHNIAALILGFQPFSLTNISAVRSIGNPLALHADDVPPGESFQHVYVLTLSALRDIFAAHGFVIERSWGRGYHPLVGALARGAARADPRHAHFIGVSARVSTDGVPA